MTTPRRKLVGSFRGDKILLATPLLRWYLEHGLELTRVYQVFAYTPIPCIRRFGDAVSTARREGDVHPNKAIIVDTMKLLGNSGYGKTITNVDRLRDVKYCTEKAASLKVNDIRFRQNDVVVDDAYEIAMNKKTSCPYMWGSSFCSTPRCACCSYITLSTGIWSVLFFSSA